MIYVPLNIHTYICVYYIYTHIYYIYKYSNVCVYIYNGYYPAIKKNETMPFATTWMDLEITVLSEVSQIEKDKHHVILLICAI